MSTDTAIDLDFLETAEDLLPVYELSYDDAEIRFSYYRAVYDDLLAESNLDAMQARLEGLDGLRMDSLYDYIIDIQAADGTPTPAFTEFQSICAQLDDYSMLDEVDFSEREHRQAAANCIDWYGDDYFRLWQQGKLADKVRNLGYLDDDVAEPKPADYPGLTELPTDGPVYDYIYACAYAAARENE